MSTYTINGVILSLLRGNIVEVQVDAIVNAANNHLWMGAGVAGAIKRKGGEDIERQAVAQGPIEIGEAVLTVAGNLPATHVIHAATMGRDLKTDPDKIAAAASFHGGGLVTDQANSPHATASNAKVTDSASATPSSSVSRSAISALKVFSP